MPFAGYDNFAECVSKNSDKSDPDAYCGSIKNQVEETDKRFLKEVDPNLMTPKKQETEPITMQSPQGEAEDRGDDAYGELDGDKYSKNEDEVKDEKREEQQGQAGEIFGTTDPADAQDEQDYLEHNDERPYSEFPDKKDEEPAEKEDKVELEGENYRLLNISKEVLNGNVIEYANRFYTPLRLKEKIGEADIDYQGTVYRPRTHTLIEYSNRIYEAVNPHTDTEPPQDQALVDKDNVDDARPLELPAEEEGGMVSGPPAGTDRPQPWPGRSGSDPW